MRYFLLPPKGVWKPQKIKNPDYFEDLQPFRMAPFRALGLELWSMTSDIYFDNFIITSHKEVADRWASDSWGLKKLVASANEVRNENEQESMFLAHIVVICIAARDANY